MKNLSLWLIAGCLLLGVLGDAATAASDKKGKKQKKKEAAVEDPYADYVWPPPPDEPRIKLEDVLTERADVEAKSKLQRTLIGASPKTSYDKLNKPFAVEIDSHGRILVTDWKTAAVIRFDREGHRMDVFGTKGGTRLKQPLGLGIGPDDTVYVADTGLKRVVAFDAEGKVISLYGREGDLLNPTDAALSPDGERLFVADSKAHHIVVFDVASGDRLSSFGSRGDGDGEFNFPTALVFGPEGNLFVLDQINSRVQVFDGEGEYFDQFGELGRGMGQFTRPKDIAVDEVGFIYVTDNAFNNVQIFDADFTLLTFVGSGGREPGTFWGASGIAVRGQYFAVVDQLGARAQIFRFLVPKLD